MERLYTVQDEVQDWLAPPVQHLDGWPRFESFSLLVAVMSSDDL